FKAAVIMTGDQHGCCAATRSRFQIYDAQSPPGCSVDDWECVRASSYLLYAGPDMADPEAQVWTSRGLELGEHVYTACLDWTGATIDCYQAPTQMTDESGLSYASTCDTLLDHALGPEGYYAALCANMHTDQPSHPGSDAIVASARARGVPVISARQMLAWLDARNSSSFTGISWNAGTLSFTIMPGAGARNLRAMLPSSLGTLLLSNLSRNGSAIP